jgi:hypothetical protein
MKNLDLKDLIYLSIDGVENMFVVTRVMGKNSFVAKNIQSIKPLEIKICFAKPINITHDTISE